MSTLAQYQNYDDVLDKSKKNIEMNYREKKKLIQLIDKLDTKDHLGILRIIMDSTTRKIYTVNNYGTYIDLDDLDNHTLWKINYYVNLCLENLEREKEKEMAEKRHFENLNNLEKNLKTRSKLKLTPQNLKQQNDEDEDSESHDDDDDILSPENVLTKKNKIDVDSESDLPGQFEPDFSEFEGEDDYE